MTYKESLEYQEKEKAFLDTIDIKSIIEKLYTDDIYDIMDAIERKFRNKYLEEESIFDSMDAYEFIEYLKQRYPEANIYERTKTTYHIIFKK